MPSVDCDCAIVIAAGRYGHGNVCTIRIVWGLMLHGSTSLLDPMGYAGSPLRRLNPLSGKDAISQLPPASSAWPTGRVFFGGQVAS